MLTTPREFWNETCKVFQDPVHGSMEIPALLVKIIDTPEFQRLRKLSQNSMTNLVYSGACHRRFEHSIGVCYLAAAMLDALERNSPEEMGNVTTEDKLCVLIAGLCHDLGHGPFSHTWEVFVRFAGGDFKHENLSKQIFIHMLEAQNGELREKFVEYNLGDREIKLIQELIDGKGDTLPKEKKFLYEIVANKKTDIDVDKWDYFLRDGLALGLKVTFDYRRLLKFTKIIIEKDEYLIAFREKERFSIEDMFRMRADLHVRAYQHMVAKKIEAMLLEALLCADQHFVFNVEGQESKLSEAHKNLEVFLKLNDSILDFIETSANPQLKEAKHILKSIARRELYRDLETYNISYENGTDESPEPVPGGLLMEIVRSVWEKEKIHIFPSQTLITTGKFRNPILKVKFYEKSKAVSRTAPTIRYNLPYSKLQFYFREEEEDRMKQKKKSICDFILKRLDEGGVSAKVDQKG